MISGVALFDYNNDGWLDIYAVSGATMPGLKKTREIHYNRLFRNNGDWTFEDVTEQAGVQGRGYTHGVVVADYDNDGDQDIFVAGLRENIFYRNNGDGSFTDVTSRAGLAEPDPKYRTLWSVAAAFFDYDRDGWLDLFVSNYCVWNPETEPICGPVNSPDYCHPKHYQGLPNSLFRNNGDGTFADVSEASGIRHHIGKGMGLGVADFDQDGWVDIYVANDTVPAFLFHNLRDGTFEEIAFESGTAYTYSGLAVSGMGVDARDVNNDGLVDIFVAAMTNEAMPFYVNLGDNTFDEMTAPSKLGMMTRDKTGWSNGIYDFNNDGWKDLFVASGDVMDPRGSFAERVLQPNTLFVNLKNGKFADAGPTAGKEFAARRAVHRGAAFGDIDNDGRIDAVVTALSGPIEVWHNVSPHPHHWLLVSAIGTKSNRDAMGTKIKVVTASGAQYNHVNTAVGYGCASDRRVHFGLGKDTIVEKLEIAWPTGTVQTLENVKADQILTIREPEE
ncbi:CRTAC1 family protein [Acidobacteria bacterium AH-259-O06]|nr:CRTAC1 family protein [Acidobacteria bacterium AH-259-O06]